MLGNLKQFSILEITYGIIFLVFLFYTTQSYNINLLQFTLVVSVVIFIIYISIIKKEDLKNLKDAVNIQNTNNESLLQFVNDIKYFELYNPPVYKDFMNKIDNYIRLEKFINFHNNDGYKMYPKEILQQNLESQRNNILNTFVTFEHTLDDRITSVYKLNDLTKKLNHILLKSNLTL